MPPLSHNTFCVLCRDDCQIDNPENWKIPSNFVTCWSPKNAVPITGKAWALSFTVLEVDLEINILKFTSLGKISKRVMSCGEFVHLTTSFMSNHYEEFWGSVYVCVHLCVCVCFIHLCTHIQMSIENSSNDGSRMCGRTPTDNVAEASQEASGKT